MAVLKGYIKATDFDIVDIFQAEFGKEIGEFIQEQANEVFYTNNAKVSYSKQRDRIASENFDTFKLVYDVEVKDFDVNEFMEIAIASGSFTEKSKPYYVAQEELQAQLFRVYSGNVNLNKRMTKLYQETMEHDYIKSFHLSFLVNKADIKGSNLKCKVFVSFNKFTY